LPDEVDYLILAYRLSVLTFYLGVLIYAMPIPWSGLKRWAPRLIWDAILSATLILASDIILEAVDRLTLLMGGSWDYLNTWITSGAAEFISMKTLAALIQSLPDPIGVLGGIKLLVKPVDRLATSALYFIGVIAGLAYLVKNYGALISALGLVLYAIPFRISRSAGAWLFSFTIIFTVGLQVLPVFVSSLAGPPQPFSPGEVAEKGVAPLQATVFSEGGGLDGELMVEDAISGEQYGVYEVNNGTVLDEMGNNIVMIPSIPPLIFKLNYMNVIFYLSPYPVNNSDYDIIGGIRRIELNSPYTIYGRKGLLSYTNGEIINVTVTSTEIDAIVWLHSGDYVAVRYINGCQITVNAPALQLVDQGEWTWRGESGKYRKYVAPENGTYNIEISYNCPPPKFTYQLSNYLGSVEKYLAFYNLNIIKAFILYWFTVPIIYLAVLTSATAGLARLLGGRERLPIRVV
jgi:hypothetical protein